MRHTAKMLALAVGMVWAVNAHAADYTIDSVHSSIGFNIKHLMVSTVTGTFDEYEGTVSFDPKDAAAFKANATIQAKSIDTRNSKRDDHLRTADFFDVEKFPTVTFVGKSLSGSGEKYTLKGDLTMKGVTKEVSFPVTISGPVKNPMGEGEIIGVEGQLTINRQDYGIKFNKDMDNGGLMLGNDVVINVNLEAHSK